MQIIEPYKQYHIARSSGGGKAGSGNNRTATIQVIELDGGGYLLKKQFRYKIFEDGSKDKAIKKAKEWIDAQE